VLAIICNLANNNVSNSDYGVTCYGNQHIYISCRLIPVCFGLRKLSVHDNLLHSMYSKVRYSSL